MYARSYTSVKLGAGNHGYAATTITAKNGVSKHEYWGGQATSTWMNSPEATVSGQRYAETVYFYADQRASVNNISTVYEGNFKEQL